MLRGNEVDVVTAQLLELEHEAGQLFGSYLPATPLPRDVVILTEDTPQIAMRKEDGPRAPHATEAVFLAMMGEGTRDASPATRLADRPLVGQPIDVAIPRTDPAGSEFLQGFLYLSGEAPRLQGR